MDQNACIVVVIECVAADVGAPIDEQDLSTRIRCEPFSHHTAGEAGPYNQIVEHANYGSEDASPASAPAR